MFLRIEPGKLDQIDKSPMTDTLTPVVEEWFKFPLNDSQRWNELGRVLSSQAVCEPAVVSRLQPYFRRNSSVESDSVAPPGSSPQGGKLAHMASKILHVNQIPTFNAAEGTGYEQIERVLNCIAPYHEWHEIGVHLNLPGDKLEEIRKYPIADQKAHFVELWRRLDPEFSERKLQQTLTKMNRSHSDDLPHRARAPPPCVSGIIERDPDVIEQEINSLEGKFRSLIKDIKNYLESKKKKVAAIHNTLSYLPQNLHEIYSAILKERDRELDKCESHRKFFFLLNDCWNFVDFELLILIIKEHGNDELKCNVDDYLEKFRQFCKSTTVKQLIEIWGPKYNLSDISQELHDNYKMLIQRSRRDAKTYTIYDLEKLWKRSSSLVLPLSKAAVLLYDMMISSVILVWLVAKENVRILTMAFSHLVKTRNSDFIDHFGIEFLCLDDCVIYPTEEVLYL